MPLLLSTSPSAELLLSVLRAGICETGSVVPEPLDAAQSRAVATLAVDTRLSFLVLRSVQESDAFGAVSSECVKQLVSQVRESAARNASHRFHARRILDACERRGIAVLLLKGLWLAEQVYREPGARDACDIDLLLRPGGLPAFLDAARELGFDVPAAAAALASDAGTTNELALWHRASGALVDVHWSITNPVSEAAVDEESLWRRSECVEIAGTRCRTLALEDHLLFLCFHAAVHHRFWSVGPRCLVDVAVVLRQPPRAIEWDELVTRARDLGWAKAAWLMFKLVELHLGVAAPADTMRSLHEEGPEDLEVCRMALEAVFAAREQDSLYRHLAQLMAAPSWRERAVALGRIIAPARVQMTNQFGWSEDTPTWRLHLRRWRGKVRALAGMFSRLLVGSSAARAELARTRGIQEWLAAGEPGGPARFRLAQAWAAGVTLVAVPLFAVLVRIMTLPRILALIEKSRGELQPGIPEATALARAVNIVANRGPWRARCLTRSLVLHWMLRSRAIGSVLRIGVARDGDFRAHAWVECGGVPVNDRADVATHFTPFDSLGPLTGQVAS